MGREEYDKLTMVANYIKISLKRKEDSLAPTGSEAVTFQKHHYSAVKMTKKNHPLPPEIMQFIGISVLNALVKYLIIRFFALETLQRESATGE